MLCVALNHYFETVNRMNNYLVRGCQISLQNSREYKTELVHFPCRLYGVSYVAMLVG